MGTMTPAPTAMNTTNDAIRREVIDTYARAIHAAAESKGFGDEREINGVVRTSSPVERMALIACEVSEMVEAYREDGDPASYYYVGFKPEGVAAELADVVIRCFDYAAEHKIPLGQVIEDKVAFNMTREHRHGGKVL